LENGEDNTATIAHAFMIARFYADKGHYSTALEYYKNTNEQIQKFFPDDKHFLIAGLIQLGKFYLEVFKFFVIFFSLENLLNQNRCLRKPLNWQKKLCQKILPIYVFA
jgi:hypothetical protein